MWSLPKFVFAECQVKLTKKEQNIQLYSYTICPSTKIFFSRKIDNLANCSYNFYFWYTGTKTCVGSDLHKIVVGKPYIIGSIQVCIRTTLPPEEIFELECIPVGCVPPAAVAVGGRCLHQAPPGGSTPRRKHPPRRSPPWEEAPPPGGSTHPRRKHPPEGSTPLGRKHPPLTEWQKPVKI